MLKDLLVYADGAKTYFLVLLALVLWLGVVFDWWTFEDTDKLFALLGLLGVGAFRSAISKMEK